MATNVRTFGASRIREQGRALGTGGVTLADVVRRVRAGLSGLSDTDHHFLHDLSRGQYKTTWFDRLIDLSARAETDDAAYALAEFIESRVAARRAQCTLALTVAITAEDRAQHAADDAVRAYTLCESDGNLARMREAAHAHEIALTQLHRAASAMADEGAS